MEEQVYDKGQGFCPKCNSDNMNYDLATIQDTFVYYPFSCDDCGTNGKEWYEMKFSNFTVEKKEE